VKNYPSNNFSTVRPICTNSILIDSIQHRLRKTANINRKRLFGLKPVVRARRSNKRVELIVIAKLFGIHFLHSHVCDYRLWQMTVYSMEKCWQHCQATSFMSDLDDVNFPVTVVNCISLYGSYLNRAG
jgi:hypothetical protein